MAKFGCPAKFIAVVRQFHDGMLARVQNDGEFSDPFPVTNGVKQGCVLASTLFSMMFSAMLTDAFQDGDSGIPIRYRFDGKLFNLRALQAKSKVQTEMLDEFLIADDMTKGAPTDEKMQKGVDQVSDSCDSYDLTISIKKTEVVYQPAPGKPYKEPTITVKGQRLQVVDKFTYLGSTLSRVVHIDDEVNARIAKASAAFGRLRGSIWDRSGIRLDTKLKVYRSVVLPTLLYACETWTVYQRHAKRLNHFHTSCLRKLLKIKWQDRIPDTEVLKRAGMQSIHTLLKLAQLRWTGHVTRMPDERLPKKILYGELQVGGLKKRYKDTLKASLKKVREKSRECHNHKPQPFPDPKRKRKPTNLYKHKPNKRTKSTKISSLFPKRGNRNTKRTKKHKNKMTHGKTYNKSPCRINHKATRSKTNTGTTALERSVEQTTGGFKALLQLANFTLGPDATLNT